MFIGNHQTFGPPPLTKKEYTARFLLTSYAGFISRSTVEDTARWSIVEGTVRVPCSYYMHSSPVTVAVAYPQSPFNGTPTWDAKGHKITGNFGNFPWIVSGILKGWEFSEIFNFQLNFQHFMRLFGQKSTELNLLCTIFKHTCSALLF